MALFTGDELFKLIPQRAPIVMVDTVVDATETEAHTALTISAENIFCADGKFREPGLIEHIAQSAAAFAGYANFLRGESPKLGYIGEIKKMKINQLPSVGEQLYTHLKVLGEAAGVTLMAVQTSVNDVVVVEGQMKIFIKEN